MLLYPYSAIYQLTDDINLIYFEFDLSASLIVERLHLVTKYQAIVKGSKRVFHHFHV